MGKFIPIKIIHRQSLTTNEKIDYLYAELMKELELINDFIYSQEDINCDMIDNSINRLFESRNWYDAYDEN